MTTDYEFTPVDVPACCAMSDYNIKTVYYGDGTRWHYVGSQGTVWQGGVNEPVAANHNYVIKGLNDD